MGGDGDLAPPLKASEKGSLSCDTDRCLRVIQEPYPLQGDPVIGPGLDTQRTLLSAQSELETTRAALSADHVRLYLALGGGWTPDAAVPNP